MRRLIWFLFAAVLGGGLGWLGYRTSETGKVPLVGELIAQYRRPPATAAPAPAAAQANPGGAPRGLPVEAQPVRVGPITQELTAVGSLRSNESVIVRPEVAGRIAEIRFNEGDPVRKGQTLVLLDAAVQRAELAQVRASLQLSRTNHQRAVELSARGAGTERQRDEALQRLRNDEAAIALAEARLAKMSIEAAFDGVLGLRKVSVGDFVQPGQDLVNLEQIDPLKVDFRVPELYLAQVRDGQAIRVAIDALPNRLFEGRVYAIDPLVDRDGRALVIRARLPNPEAVLKPGLFARVNLVLAERERAITVPEDAIVPVSGGQSVFKVVNGQVQSVPVVLGIRRGGWVEVVQGLEPDAVVITAGQIKVRPGMPVTVIPPRPAGQGPGQGPGQGSGQAPVQPPARS